MARCLIVCLRSDLIRASAVLFALLLASTSFAQQPRGPAAR